MAMTSWREMDYSARFLAVNRWSMVAGPWLIAAVLAFTSIVHARHWGPELFAGVAVAFVSCAAGSIALHTNQKLRLQPHPRGEAWLKIGLVGQLVALALSCAVATFAPEEFTRGAATAALGIYLTILVAYLPFLPHSLVSSALLIAAAVAVTARVTDRENTIMVLTYSVVFALFVPMGTWFSRAMIETERARRLETQLTAAQERLRLSQDLHDTMGQHLAAMTIKTQLALALAARGDGRLTEELDELHQLTQSAAADLRHVVNRYRTPDLDTELTGAQQVLTQAGAEVTLSGTSTDVPAGLRETAAWFVREAATNVLRHSQATQVTIDLGPEGVTVTNDHPEPSERPGAGLEGLRRRAAPHGARLVVEQSPEQFTIALKVGA